MKDSTLDTWKKLQEEGYFENHPLYDCKSVGIPHCVEAKEIQGKTIVEIGCGYGRDTRFFASYAKKVYAIEVSQTILNKCKAYLTKKHQTNPVEYVLTEEYKEKIPNEIDYAYALHVFQHLHPNQAKDYINTFYNKLNVRGKLNIQFYIGTDKMMEEGQEPRVCYTEEEAMELFKEYHIEKTWTLNKYNVENKLQYKHFYVIARKDN